MESSEFSVRAESRDGHVVIRVSGELDELTAPDLDGELNRCVDGKPVVVDLSGVTFISSSALHVLLRPRPGGRPAVVCPSRNITRILDIVGARRAIPIFADLDAAVSSLTLSADGRPTSIPRRRRALRR